MRATHSATRRVAHSRTSAITCASRTVSLRIWNCPASIRAKICWFSANFFCQNSTRSLAMTRAPSVAVFSSLSLDVLYLHSAAAMTKHTPTSRQPSPLQETYRPATPSGHPRRERCQWGQPSQNERGKLSLRIAYQVYYGMAQMGTAYATDMAGKRVREIASDCLCSIGLLRRCFPTG